MEKFELHNNEAENRYEYHVGEYTPHILYKKRPGEIALTHTDVPRELRGKGIAKMLVKDVLDDIAAKNQKVIPLCGFVATYIRKNPEYKSLMKEGITIG